jgi:L-malate glycosyltransferase
MAKESILMTLKQFPETSGHSSVVKNLYKNLSLIGYDVTIGAYNKSENFPDEINFVKIKKNSNLSNIEGKKFDIIHNHQTSLNYHSLWTKSPFIFHYHGTSNKIQKLNLDLSLKLCKKNISYLISVSKSALNKIDSLGDIPSEVIYNGVDTKFFKPQNETIFKKGDPQLLFVGNLYPYKNIEKLIEIIPRIKDVFPNIHLQIAGNGKHIHFLKKLVKEQKIEKNIEFLGNVQHEELKKIYNSTDIYISSSKMEANPLPPIEAMSCGKPILLSDISPHREIIENSNGGLIFSLKNNDILEKLKRVYYNKQEFGQNGRKFAEKQDWIEVSKKIATVYERILS